MAEVIIFNDKEVRMFTNDFSRDRAIGKPGAFGQVYKGRIRGENYASCPRKVAVKVSKLKDDRIRRMWQQEIDSLSSISDGNVIKLVGYAESKEYYALDGSVKIADFGLATKKNEKMFFFQERRVGIFNPCDTEKAQDKFDVYCFGNLMRELVLREKEWSPTKCPRIQLADACIAPDPDSRPSMAEVVASLEKIQMERIQSESGSSRKAKRELGLKQKKKASTSLIESFLPRNRSK
ncbi:hypothetical protein ACP70R_016180 [Stipagrostis hirtigluma subsp. patula]